MTKKDPMMAEAYHLSNFQDLTKISWNVPKIRNQINELSQEIRMLKKQMREPHHKIQWQEQCELGALRHRVTTLVVLQAFRREKLHFSNKSAEEQFEWLEDHLRVDDRRELARIELTS